MPDAEVREADHQPAKAAVRSSSGNSGSGPLRGGSGSDVRHPRLGPAVAQARHQCLGHLLGGRVVGHTSVVHQLQVGPVGADPDAPHVAEPHVAGRLGSGGIDSCTTWTPSTSYVVVLRARVRGGAASPGADAAAPVIARDDEDG